MAELAQGDVHYGPPPPPPRRFDWKRLIVMIIAVVVIAAGGIAMLLYLGFAYGVGPTLVGLAGAILPVPLLVSAFLWLDRYEPEPWKRLAFCFAWGACVATAVALVVNTLMGEWVFPNLGVSGSHVATLVAPFIEESMKALGPLLLYIFVKRSFSGPTDGIVYFGLSAVGFAMMENILYMGGIYVRTSADTGLVSQGAISVVVLFVVRVVMSGFAHPLFTSMTGIAVGFAARSSNKVTRTLLPLSGLMMAMMLHGTWNLMATLSAHNQLVFLYGYFGLMVPIFFGVFGFALWTRAQDGRIAGRVLPAYVRTAWMTPPEVASLITVGRRLTARYWARRVAGASGAQAMRGYQDTATKLALLRDGAERGLAGPDFAAEELRLLHDLAAYRNVFTGRDPLTPQGRWDGSVYHLVFPDRSVRAVAPSASPVVPIPVAPPPPPPPPPMYGYQPYPYGYRG
ncbi:protease PrsW [Longispora fulva]|uniref:RsiW-degrading membrane proteinase PrsW (M82 family) n=1 Tax=Longispora fulva TaxID=619741 RepID=A0A8J7GJR1_9ACTN|nr:PrsW family intramembrane metalloprotease [Longispora fulva]MBG6139421.1 RsiW-degrading membrane proteinase PrsW (M82 family) [Longispora fulva]GIG58920.1 protease PrsW [Longispora fulva]